MGLFASEEVNTGRQKEYDHLKGLFMVFIFIVHAFQATMSDMDPAVLGIWIFATMSGAAIFIFVMGFGTAYSRKTEPKDLASAGVRLILYQYLNDLTFVAAIVIPYPFVMNRLSAAGTDNVRMLIWVYSQYINIFFISGIIYLVLALMKKMNCRIWIYPLLGVITALAAPFLYDRPVNIPVLSYIAKLLIGDAQFISFIPIYYISYALIGVGAGHLYRHIRDKRRFYLAALPVTAVIAAVWWIRAFMLYGDDISRMSEVMEQGYAYPDILHVLVSVAHIILLASIIFFISERKKKTERKESLVSSQILRYSRHISKYYALHILVYFAALGFHGYLPFRPWQCWLLALLSMVITEGEVRVAEYLESRREREIDTGTIFIYAATYWVMMVMLIFRVYQLNHSREILSAQQFEMVSWWVFIVMIAATQILFVRNRRMAEKNAMEQTLLDAAREIQEGIVPCDKEYIKGNVRITAFAKPARSVGGDFYDIIPIDEGRVGVVMGDVSGKGIPAALFMSMVKTMIRDRMMSGMSPEEVLNRVNDEVCAENPKGMFATVFIGVMDTKDGKLIYANAGHMHPVKTGESPVCLEPDNGCAIGLFEDIGIVRGETVIEPGEGLLLYTDGVTEAVNRAKVQYGEKRLLRICKESAGMDPVRAVADDVIQYSEGLVQFDDLTLLAIQYMNTQSETGGQ